MMKGAILACFEDADFEFSVAINISSSHRLLKDQ